MNKDKLTEMIMSVIEKCIGDSQQDNHKETEVAVVKSVEQMEQRALFVVLSPSEDDGTTTDLHGDWYSADDVAEACANFNIACRKSGLDHSGLLSDEDVVIEQSFTAPCDFTTETGVFIKKGTWLQWWKFNNPVLWQGVLDGTYTGVSIECSAMGYELE